MTARVRWKVALGACWVRAGSLELGAGCWVLGAQVGGRWRDADGPIAAGGSAVCEAEDGCCAALRCCSLAVLLPLPYEAVAAQARLGW